VNLPFARVALALPGRSAEPSVARLAAAPGRSVFSRLLAAALGAIAAAERCGLTDACGA
jgi:hypothetical protein